MDKFDAIIENRALFDADPPEEKIDSKKFKKYGYGIVDCNDEIWWGDDWCVCGDFTPVKDMVEQLNDDLYPDYRQPYRIIKLYFNTQPYPY